MKFLKVTHIGSFSYDEDIGRSGFVLLDNPVEILINPKYIQTIQRRVVKTSDEKEHRIIELTMDSGRVYDVSEDIFLSNELEYMVINGSF